MENPFVKRATEMLRDDEAFLSIVSPAPLSYFLKRPAQDGCLYDRLVLIEGTPGSGKTTIGRLFEYSTVCALLKHSHLDVYRTLASALSDCRATDGIHPLVVGCRIPLESDYRDIWELPYPDALKLGLLTGLVQARALLGWIRHLRSQGATVDQIAIVPRAGAEASLYAIEASTTASAIERARGVETAIYQVIASLAPPPIDELDPRCTEAYRPFDVVEGFRVIQGSEGGPALDLQPLVILDDAHVLHPDQFAALRRWLVRRELRVARWILTRFDALSPEESFASMVDHERTRDEMPGVTKDRDTTRILLQSERKDQRRAFRPMAKDMADRYLRQMPLFSERDLKRFSDLLSESLEMLPPGKVKDLASKVGADQQELKIPDVRRNKLADEVRSYVPSGSSLPNEVSLAMLRILMHRHVGRLPQGMLFADDRDPTRPVAADTSVFDAARLQLLHEFGYPYYYGIDDLCDASSENAEQFLRLAATLVEVAASRLIRSQSPLLEAGIQNKTLRDRATQIINDWNFPQYRLVKHLADGIARRCLQESLRPNAWLGAGANAFGIPQDEFAKIPSGDRDLAQVLHYGVAYKAFDLVPNYSCKGKQWCLLELGGLVILHHGLTLKRGGFIEATTKDLHRLVWEV